MALMKNAARFLSFMIIRTLGPNSVNRDDRGNFKTTWFGGVERRRISSQCVKRAVRKALNKILEVSNYRTHEVPRLVKEELEKDGVSDIVDRLSKIFVNTKNKTMLEGYDEFKKGKKKEEELSFKSKVSIFLSKDELDLVVEEAKKPLDEIRTLNNLVEGAEKRYGSVIALFGRFMAEATSMNIEGATLVSHEFSTHEVMNEDDYFIVENELGMTSGGGHLGHTSYGCATTYLHAVLDLDTLKANLVGFSEDQVKEIVSSFTEALVKHFPQGAEHPFFAQTLPDYVRVDATPHPITMAGAFEAPIQPRKNEGFTKPSIERLEQHRTKQMEKGYEVEETCGGEQYKIEDLKNFVASRC